MSLGQAQALYLLQFGKTYSQRKTERVRFGVEYLHKDLMMTFFTLVPFRENLYMKHTVHAAL